MQDVYMEQKTQVAINFSAVAGGIGAYSHCRIHQVGKLPVHASNVSIGPHTRDGGLCQVSIP